MARPLNIDVKPGMFIRYKDGGGEIEIIAEIESYELYPAIINGHAFTMKNQGGVGMLLSRSNFKIGNEVTDLISNRESAVWIKSMGCYIVGKTVTKNNKHPIRKGNK